MQCGPHHEQIHENRGQKNLKQLLLNSVHPLVDRFQLISKYEQ
jgi:hypothetical protein